MKAEIDTQQNQIDTQQNEIVTLKVEKVTMQNQIDTLQKQLTNATETIRSLRVDKKDQKQKVETLEGKVKMLEDDLAAAMKIAANVSLVQVELHKVSLAAMIKLRKMETMVTEAEVLNEIEHEFVRRICESYSISSTDKKGKIRSIFELDVTECRSRPKRIAYTRDIIPILKDLFSGMKDTRNVLFHCAVEDLLMEVSNSLMAKLRKRLDDFEAKTQSKG